jgi:hypothetical protein
MLLSFPSEGDGDAREVSMDFELEGSIPEADAGALLAAILSHFRRGGERRSRMKPSSHTPLPDPTPQMLLQDFIERFYLRPSIYAASCACLRK